MNTPQTDPHPYGPPPRPSYAPKTALTMRGKAAVVVASAAIAGGTFIGYQAYAASTAASEAKSQEIALQQSQLDLERLRELNRLNSTSTKTQVSAADRRQVAVDKCIDSKVDQVGKTLGSPTYRDLVDACQAQYTSPTSTGGDLQTAANEQSDGSSNGPDGGLLIGAGALGLIVIAGAKFGRRSNPA